MKKWMYTFLIAAMLWLLPMEASAGSLRLRLDVGELPVTNGAFTLYRVGTPISDGYRIEDAYGGGFVRQEDSLSPHLAQWLNGMEGKEGICILMDVDGKAYFSDLVPGLYLLEQSERTDGFYPIQPFLFTIPWKGRPDAAMQLQPLPMVAASPPTGQDLTPYIGVAGMILALMGLLICNYTHRRCRR